MRADGIPSEVQIVRSEFFLGGGVFRGDFQRVCNDFLILQEFTSSSSPEFNGVAERGLGIIDAAANAAQLEAGQSSRTFNFHQRSRCGGRGYTGPAKPSTAPPPPPIRKVSRNMIRGTDHQHRRHLMLF